VIDPELDAESPPVGPRMLRQFAAVWLTLFGVLSGWSMYRGHDGAAIVFAMLALAAGPLGLVRPDAIRPLFLALTAVTRPIGIVVTRLILGVVFYGLFTPLAILFQAVGRDALRRRRDSDRSTYWTQRSPVRSVRRYFQQY
jgi:Saxitoxin biosynthesis operon protein SxtJ